MIRFRPRFIRKHGAGIFLSPLQRFCKYRSKTFQELVGQEHIVTALKNAITENRVGHAYLFSGPRGTGKTSTARILGKALNCIDLQEGGEPCCKCDSCDSFTDGTSYDLQELDAASNNGVEAVRELISKVALGSPGKIKIYILRWPLEWCSG